MWLAQQVAGCGEVRVLVNQAEADSLPTFVSCAFQLGVSGKLYPVAAMHVTA